jgi:hypothetical protein
VVDQARNVTVESHREALKGWENTTVAYARNGNPDAAVPEDGNPIECR